jgi:hypothetical protein
MGIFNFIGGKHTDLSKQPFMRMNYRTVCSDLAHNHRDDAKILPTLVRRWNRARRVHMSFPAQAGSESSTSHVADFTFRYEVIIHRNIHFRR